MLAFKSNVLLKGQCARIVVETFKNDQQNVKKYQFCWYDVFVLRDSDIS